MAKEFLTQSSDGSSRRRTVFVADYWKNEATKRGIVDYARTHGWHLLDLNSYSLELTRSIRPDGILFNLPVDNASLVRQLLRLGAPVVEIDHHYARLRCPHVIRDRRAIGRAGAEHFAERGFRRMAYLRSESWQHHLDRLVCESFLEHARALGATAHAFELQRLGQPVPWTRIDVFADRLRKELERIQLPVGVFTFHDTMATRVCHFCAAAGLSVPEQVAVLGIGNDPLTCDCASVPLSSVDPNRFAQGRIAAELLDRLMNGEAVPAELVVAPLGGVVARKSTDVLAVPDLDTARALRYLWEHLAEPLSVRSVAEAVGVSRRTLDRAFRAHLGRSVIDELNRKRIERCCELLIGTRQSAFSIARQTGFRTEPYMFRVFRKQMGTTPKKYRLAHAAIAREGAVVQRF